MVPAWATPDTLRDLRRAAVQRALYYRAEHHKHGDGLDRRMAAQMLAQAAEYRTALHEEARADAAWQQHQQEAA